MLQALKTKPFVSPWVQLLSTLEENDLIDIKELEVNSVRLSYLCIFLESCSQLQQLLCNINLNIAVKVLVKLRVLFIAEVSDLLWNDLLELLWPLVVLDLVLCINIDLIKLQKLLFGKRLLWSLEFVKLFKQSRDDWVL